jgi:dTDP-4-amino-4,6-dideoxygalactose transaminase
VSHAIAFSSGRGSLFAILRELKIEKGDEVIVQAFTCAAVIQAILTTGATPIYTDIDDTLTVSIENINKHISKKTKAIIVQYTFGIPANIDELQKIARKNNIFLIEDAAHTIGGTYNNKLLGTFGIASIVSLGRDKAFSCVSGGVAITNDMSLGENIKIFAQKQGYPTRFWIFQQLLHTVAFYFAILPFYTMFIGKLVLVFLQQLHLLSVPVDTTRTKLSDEEIKQLPPVLSRVALVQLERLHTMNKRRLEIAHIYEKELSSLQQLKLPHDIPLLRFPLLMKDAKDCISYFRKHNIKNGKW